MFSRAAFCDCQSKTNVVPLGAAYKWLEERFADGAGDPRAAICYANVNQTLILRERNFNSSRGKSAFCRLASVEQQIVDRAAQPLTIDPGFDGSWRIREYDLDFRRVRVRAQPGYGMSNQKIDGPPTRMQRAPGPGKQ